MAPGAALAAKQGKRSKSSLKGASKEMAESMSEKQLKDFAKTKRGQTAREKEKLREICEASRSFDCHDIDISAAV